MAQLEQVHHMQRLQLSGFDFQTLAYCYMPSTSLFTLFPVNLLFNKKPIVPKTIFSSKTDQRSGPGVVDAGPRSCGVRVGEQPVDLTQRHATSTVAHLIKNTQISPRNVQTSARTFACED